MRNIIKRAKAKTPPFFKKLQGIGLVIATAATAMLAVPVTLPAAVTTAAGYLLTAGTVATAVSQLSVQTEEEFDKKTEPRGGGINDNSNKS